MFSPQSMSSSSSTADREDRDLPPVPGSFPLPSIPIESNPLDPTSPTGSSPSDQNREKGTIPLSSVLDRLHVSSGSTLRSNSIGWESVETNSSDEMGQVRNGSSQSVTQDVRRNRRSSRDRDMLGEVPRSPTSIDSPVSTTHNSPWAPSASARRRTDLPHLPVHSSTAPVPTHLNSLASGLNIPSAFSALDHHRNLNNQTPDSTMSGGMSDERFGEGMSNAAMSVSENISAWAKGQHSATDASESIVEEDHGEDDDEPYEEDHNEYHPPVFQRTYSCPLPARVAKKFARPQSRLRNDSSLLFSTPPLTNGSGGTAPSEDIVTPASNHLALQTLSSELSDSLQSAIQTLLHLSPPHLLDNAKEQYSGCTVQMPTTSLSALLTAMKGLNYLSANVSSICEDLPAEQPVPISKSLPASRHASISLTDPSGRVLPNPLVPGPPPPKTVSGTKVAPSSASAAISSRPVPQPHLSGILDNVGKTPEDFDIGELLQSTADLLGGQAAQAGVEIVLFHGDVGIKHMSVAGDGEGLGYALSFVIRQLLSVCRPGDTLELGLQITPQSPSLTPRINMPLTAAEVDQTKRASQISITEEAGRISPGETSISKTGDALSGPLLVTLEMVHSFTGNRRDSLATTPRASAPLGTADRTGRAEPDFNGLLCRRILKHVNAVLHPRAPEEELSYFATSNTGQNRTYELSVLLARGEPMDDSTALSAEEQAARQPFASLKLDREPTLNELSVFASSLRGKRVELHASLLSVFARHLTSYLAAWGMDVSHVPVEDEPQGSTFTTDTGEIALRSANEATTPGGIAGNLNPNSLSVSQSSVASDSNLPQGDRFIIIDDDVAVLKRQLLKLRAEATPFGLRPRNLKRPTLAGRTRSSPHVRTLQQNALPQINPLPSEVRQPTAVIHFTSLAKYNHVRDVVASILTNSPGSWPHPPEVMVIPKPVGPRRFLTALHTAVQRPVVDPYFTPIATSPRSPGGGYFPPFATKNSSHIPAESPLRMSHGNDYMGYEYQNSGRRSGHPSPAMEATHGRVSDGSVSISTTAGDYLATPAGSYFSSPAVSGAGSAAQGVFVRDSSGQHMGVFFDPSKPEGKESRRTASGGKLENLRRKVSITARSTSGPNAKTTDSPSAPASPSRRLSAISTTSSQDDRSSRRSSTLNPVHDEAEPVSEATPGSITRSIGRVGSSRRRVSGEGSAVQRERSGTVTQGDRPNIRSYQSSGSQSDALTVAQVAEMVSSPSLQDISERTSRRLMAVEATRAARLKAEAELAAAQAPVKTGKGNASKTAIVVPPINVLIVEDNPINQNILSMFLRKRKIKHQAANNGQEAVEKWKTGTFHLILMDIQLPVMDGIEATKLIRKSERNSNIGFFPSTPSLDTHKTLSPVVDHPLPGTPLRSSVIIVALTASSFHQDRVNALAAGCNDFLTKPVSLKWLESKIIEWGCMQALIDFEGWRQWKSVDARDKGMQEAKKAVQSHSDANALKIANKLRLPKKPSRTALSDDERASRIVTPSEHGPDVGPTISVTQPTPDVGGSTATSQSLLPTDPLKGGGGGETSSVDTLQKSLENVQLDRPPPQLDTITEATAHQEGNSSLGHTPSPGRSPSLPSKDSTDINGTRSPASPSNIISPSSADKPLPPLPPSEQ